ncbi:MAG: hypothetical protein M0Z34_02570 [Nitrospiraceae bacterium]|nr:hypothetical protein [Nitrospiraceae bacterium]
MNSSWSPLIFARQVHAATLHRRVKAGVLIAISYNLSSGGNYYVASTLTWNLLERLEDGGVKEAGYSISRS